MSLADNTKLLWFAEAGDKKRVSTIHSFLTKGYDASYTNVNGEPVFNENHLVQTTELNQPRLRGNIAPNETLCVYNGNGEGRYFNHSQIDFSATEPWSTTSVIQLSTRTSNGNQIFGHSSLYDIRDYNGLRILTPSGSPYIYGSLNNHAGKSFIISIIYNGVDSVLTYVNGNLASTVTLTTAFTFSRFMGATNAPNLNMFGKAYYHRIQSGAMTAQQVADEATMLRSWIPEMESVVIGNQEWATSNLDMVCTPMGNVIPEMQLASDTEMLTNEDDRTFASDTGNWYLGTGVSISTNQLHFDLDAGLAYNTEASSPIGSWCLCEFEIVSLPASGYATIGIGGSTSPQFTTTGVHQYYLKVATSNVGIVRNSLSNTVIDNISFKQVGWAGIGYLYTWLTTEGGYTDEDAYKEVAAWCYYDNDPDNGAIYGKLYNWYAAKLLQNDIDDYNTANPTAEWGWHVPTISDFTTLISTGIPELKSTGNYWTTPLNNNNSSGFTALGSGQRYTVFVNTKTFCILLGIDNVLYIQDDNTAIHYINTPDKNYWGRAIRLIKD